MLLLALTDAADPPPTTVAVDVAALDEEAYRQINALALEQQVLLRLAQEGFAVVVQSASPQILIRLQVLPDRIVVVDVADPARRSRVVMTGGEPVRELTHLEVAQKIVELARASRAALRAPRTAA